MRTREWALELIGWSIVALVGAVTITQTFRWGTFRWGTFRWAATRSIAVIQSLTPYLGLLVVPIAFAALSDGSLPLAIVSAAIGVGLVILAAPLAFPKGQADPIADAHGLRVASINLLYRNERIGDVARTLTELAPDVITLSECTPEHHAALQCFALTRDYPHRIAHIGPLVGGVAVWSRTPLVEAEPPDTYKHSVDVIVDGPDGEVRVVAVHTPTPLTDFVGWRSDLRTAARIARDASSPTMVIGDFNATYWHPDFRRVLDAGLVDAHAALGKGFSGSWPTDRLPRRFVRLDHALTTAGLVSTEVVDFDIPGSDHRGFVVTVVPAR